MYEQLDCCYEWMDDEYIGAPLYNLQEQEKDAAKTCFWSQYGRWARKAEEKKQTILDREEKQDICIMYYMYVYQGEQKLRFVDYHIESCFNNL